MQREEETMEVNGKDERELEIREQKGMDRERLITVEKCN
jgi:hypothetical protein